jgi:hypothetical protein
MSTVEVADLVRLAEVKSASLHVYELLGAPAAVLEVVAQSSGFNWDLRIRPGFAEKVEYYPYLVVETKMSPDWPPQAGQGPVVPPATLLPRCHPLGEVAHGSGPRAAWGPRKALSL